MKRSGFVVLISGIVGVGLVAGAAKDFSVYQGQQMQEDDVKVVNPFGEALPYDFWGDYSHAEFGEDNATGEIVGENPFSAAYHYHPAYEGDGHQSFHDYTGAFNLALVNGYSGLYEEHYKAFATSAEQVEGFWGLEPDGTLLDVSYYVEDWIVWNSNEVQNYDDDIGRAITNEDISFEGGGRSIVDDGDELSKIFVKDYAKMINLSIGNALTSDYGYLYYFEQQPLSSEGINIGIPPREDGKYYIYPLERLIIDDSSEKIEAEGLISAEEAHTALKAYDYTDLSGFKSLVVDENEYYWAQMDKLSGFEYVVNEKIYEGLNRDSELVKEYGGDYVKGNDAVLINAMQTYQTGFVSLSDYEVSYEVSDDGKDGVEANTLGDRDGREDSSASGHTEQDPNNFKLDDIDYLRVTIEFKDSERTEASKVSEMFKPKYEGGISDDPDKGDDEKGWLVPLILIVVTFVFSIAGIFVKRWVRKSGVLKR